MNPALTESGGEGLAAVIFLREIQFGTNRVRLVFSAIGTEQPFSAIDFEVQSGWLVGGVEQMSGKQQFSESDRDELSTAILGLYKTAGAEIVRQQLEIALPAPIPAYDLSARGLRIWPDSSFETEVFYEFSDEANYRAASPPRRSRTGNCRFSNARNFFFASLCSLGKTGSPFGTP